MSVKDIEQAITELVPSDVALLANWFAEFQSDLWDSQIEHDVRAGKLDRLIAEAEAEHDGGQTRPL